MRLDLYLKQNGISGRDFAALVGVHPSQVTRWSRRERVPSIATAAKIRAKTAGAVTAEDFERQVAPHAVPEQAAA